MATASKTMLTRIGGAIGMVLLCSSPLTYILSGEAGIAFWGKTLLGLVLVIVALVNSPEIFRKSLGSRSTGLWAITAAGSLMVIGVVTAINVFFVRENKTFDLTREGLY